MVGGTQRIRNEYHIDGPRVRDWKLSDRSTIVTKIVATKLTRVQAAVDGGRERWRRCRRRGRRWGWRRVVRVRCVWMMWVVRMVPATSRARFHACVIVGYARSHSATKRPTGVPSLGSR